MKLSGVEVSLRCEKWGWHRFAPRYSEAEGRGKGRPFGGLGGVLGGSLGVLEGLGAVLGRRGAILSRLGALLDPQEAQGAQITDFQ